MQLSIFSKGFLQKITIAALVTGVTIAPELIATPAAQADSAATAAFAAQIANLSSKTTNPAFASIVTRFTGFTNSSSFDWYQVMFQSHNLSRTQLATYAAIQPDIQSLLSFSATSTDTALVLINDVISKMQNLNPDITSDQALGFLQALEQQSLNNMLPLISKEFLSSDVVTAFQNAMTSSLTSSSSSVQGIFSAAGPYPVVTGVANGQAYDTTGVAPQFNGTGTLDGQSFSTGTLVNALGTHTLTVTNSYGNVTTVQFTIAKPAAGGGPIPGGGTGAVGTGSTGSNTDSVAGNGNSSGSGSSQNGGLPVISIPTASIGKGVNETAIDATSSLSLSTTQSGLVSANVDPNQLIQLAQAVSNGSGSTSNANNGFALVLDLTAKSPSAMGGTITVPLKGITGIQSLNANNSLAVKTTEGTFNVPVSTLSTANLAGVLGINPSALDQNQAQVSIQIQPASAAVQASALQTAGNNGDTLAAQVIDFSLTVSNNGRSAMLNNFGSTFVAHSIPVASIDPAHTVAVHVNVNQDASGNVTGTELDPVPTQFASGSVTALTNHDSSYSVVVTNKSFADIDSSWAKQDILSLANKLIVKGIDQQNYGPGQNVTRAELAAMIVRALGLDSVQTTDFSDVTSGDWFAGAVGAAVKAGVINGEGDGTFHPNDNVSRQDAAVMIDRALHYVGITDSGSLAAVNNFADSGSISSYAQTAIASMIDDGVFSTNGYGDGQVHPNDSTTREQMAKMILKFMEKGNLIAE